MIAVKHTEMLAHGSNRYEKKVERTNVHSKTEESGSPVETPKTVDEVAKVAGVNEKTVRRAKKALEVAPEKAEAMITGETTT